MPTPDDVYRKYGKAAEAAQLLETQLDTMLFLIGAADDTLLPELNPKRASDLLGRINRHTLGQLLKHLNSKTQSIDQLDAILSKAIEERNRLSHFFFRQHNIRRNSDEGRTLMLKDLESIHDTLLEAYRAIMLLSGIDMEAARCFRIQSTNPPPTTLNEIRSYSQLVI